MQKLVLKSAYTAGLTHTSTLHFTCFLRFFYFLHTHANGFLNRPQFNRILLLRHYKNHIKFLSRPFDCLMIICIVNEIPLQKWVAPLLASQCQHQSRGEARLGPAAANENTVHKASNTVHATAAVAWEGFEIFLPPVPAAGLFWVNEKTLSCTVLIAFTACTNSLKVLRLRNSLADVAT